MKVLLLADPPMGDKVSEHLKAIPGVTVEYHRGARDHALINAIRPGFDYALVMNGKSLGAALKERARRHGLRYIPCPPSWAQAEKMLRDDGFFANLSVGATALTHRPFSLAGEAIVAGHALEAAKDAAKQASIVLTPVPKDAPPKKEPHVVQPPEDAPAKVVGIRLRDGMTCHGELEGKEPAAVAAVPGVGVVVAQADAPVKIVPTWEVLARRIFEENPEALGRGVYRTLREAGVSVGKDGRTALYRVRREVRAAKGLDPSGCCGWTQAPRRDEVKIEVRATEPAPTAPAQDGLPPGVLAAAELLARELRAAGLEGWLRVSDTGEVDGDLAVRRKLALAGVRVSV